MSTEYWPIACIGLRIPKNKLIITRLKRDCTCPVEGYFKYCPECGKPWSKMKDVPDESLVSHKPDSSDWRVLGYRLMWQHRRPEESKFAILCVINTDSTERVYSLNIPLLSLEMKQKTEPLGLWNESEFGLHALQYWI